jgi:hypothetical protein
VHLPCISLHPLTPPAPSPQVSLKAEGEAAATKLELRSKRFAGFTHALHDLQPQPAEKCACVCVCVCAGPDSRRCRGLPPGVAGELYESCTGKQGRRDIAGRLRGVAARHDCPRLQLAQGGAVLSWRARTAGPKPAAERLPIPRHSAPPAGSCSSARTPTAPPTWPPTCNRHRATEWCGCFVCAAVGPRAGSAGRR